MTKTSIVKDIKSAGEPYTGQYGTLYGFYVTFENGDNGKYNSKSADQNKFAVGQEATYDYIPREYNGKTYYTVKPVNPQYATSTPTTAAPAATGGSMSTNESIIRQTALKAAAELGHACHVAGDHVIWPSGKHCFKNLDGQSVGRQVILIQLPFQTVDQRRVAQLF